MQAIMFSISLLQDCGALPMQFIWHKISMQSFENLIPKKDERFMVLKRSELVDPSQYPSYETIPNWQLIISEHILASLTKTNFLDCFKSELICRAVAVQWRWRRTRFPAFLLIVKLRQPRPQCKAQAQATGRHWLQKRAYKYTSCDSKIEPKQPQIISWMQTFL